MKIKEENHKKTKKESDLHPSAHRSSNNAINF